MPITNDFVADFPQELLPVLQNKLATKLPNGMRIAWDEDEPDFGMIYYQSSQSSLLNMFCCGAREQKVGGIRIATQGNESRINANNFFHCGSFTSKARELALDPGPYPLPNNLGFLLSKTLKEHMLLTLVENKPDFDLDIAERILEEQVNEQYKLAIGGPARGSGAGFDAGAPLLGGDSGAGFDVGGVFN